MHMATRLLQFRVNKCATLVDVGEVHNAKPKGVGWIYTKYNALVPAR